MVNKLEITLMGDINKLNMDSYMEMVSDKLNDIKALLVSILIGVYLIFGTVLVYAIHSYFN